MSLSDQSQWYPHSISFQSFSWDLILTCTSFCSLSKVHEACLFWDTSITNVNDCLPICEIHARMHVIVSIAKLSSMNCSFLWETLWDSNLSSQNTSSWKHYFFVSPLSRSSVKTFRPGCRWRNHLFQFRGLSTFTPKHFPCLNLHH